MYKMNKIKPSTKAKTEFFLNVQAKADRPFNQAKTDRPVQTSLQEIDSPVSTSASSSLHVQYNIIALTQW